MTRAEEMSIEDLYMALGRIKASIVLGDADEIETARQNLGNAFAQLNDDAANAIARAKENAHV